MRGGFLYFSLKVDSWIQYNRYIIWVIIKPNKNLWNMISYLCTWTFKTEYIFKGKVRGGENEHPLSKSGRKLILFLFHENKWPEATQVAIIPDGMSALTFLYLDCLTCLLVPILFQKKRFQMKCHQQHFSTWSIFFYNLSMCHLCPKTKNLW